MTNKVIIILKSLFIFIYIILGVTFVVPLIFTAFFYNYLFGFRCERTTTCDALENYPDLRLKQMDFLSGKTKLSAAAYRNTFVQKPKGLLVFCHGIGCGKDNYLNRIDYFAKEGYIVFAYDMTGVCASDGKGQRGVPQATLDLKCALEFVLKQIDFEGLPIVVYSHSWSGFAAASVLNFDDFNIVAEVNCGGFRYSSDISKIYVRKFMGNIYKLVMPYLHIVEFFRFGKCARFGAMEGINKFNKPILIMHSEDDTTIPYDDSIVAKKDKCTNSKAEFFTYKDRGHTISRPVENEDRVKASFSAIGKIRGRYRGESYFRHNIDTHYQGADYKDIYTLDPEFMKKVSDFYDKALLEQKK